ncbi:cupin domain-containing protein [Nocardioides sp. InS609-2]|uniref:cupin domain-containing protein n=1 Tax=Nocardioides sp. InS609-2 TaxID=2760705 RepID=UPI00180BC088|nr:cupin domain-containing protein [Nocardioides sp. InS609-2]MBA3782401.1 cupin domain-containing protein [Nocardioides sp.]
MTATEPFHIIDTRASAQPDGKVLDNIQGFAYGAGVSIIIEETDVEGAGPFLHQHPYSETFVIHSGKALFTVAGEQLVGEGGMLLVVPELTPHKFEVMGPDRYRATHIHASDRFITDWLEGPRAAG